MPQYDEPDTGGGTKLYPADIINHLLLVWAVGYIPHSPTIHSRPDKPSDVIVVDVVDLDMIDEATGLAGLVGRKVWWRQARLIADLKRKVGGQNGMLVRMGKGPATKGQAPFVITSMVGDQACTRRADAWWERNAGFTPSTWEELPQEPARPEVPATLDDARVNQGQQPEWSTPPPATPNPEHQSQLKRMAAGYGLGTSGLPPASPEQAGY